MVSLILLHHKSFYLLSLLLTNYLQANTISSGWSNAKNNGEFTSTGYFLLDAIFFRAAVTISILLLPNSHVTPDRIKCDCPTPCYLPLKYRCVYQIDGSTSFSKGNRDNSRRYKRRFKHRVQESYLVPFMSKLESYCKRFHHTLKLSSWTYNRFVAQILNS